MIFFACLIRLMSVCAKLFKFRSRFAKFEKNHCLRGTEIRHTKNKMMKKISWTGNGQ